MKIDRGARDVPREILPIFVPMRPIALLLLALVLGPCALAQRISCSPQDRELFEAKLAELQGLNGKDLGDSLVNIGKGFLGTPYVEKTLEIGPKETLVINLRGLDCTTFVENVLALGLLLQHGERDFGAFAKHLRTLRYRDGKLEGYPSRLHYFTDWIRNNAKKGLVEDITAELGGVELQKSLDFMGTHRALYPFLAQEENYRALLEVEAGLAGQPLCYLPKDKIREREPLIRSGDIIALATSVKGLDVTHTGLAVQMPNGRLHLLHASSAHGEVELSREPLSDYLENQKGNIGIIVARPLLAP